MAGASLLTLIDDIATLLDDVAVMTKVAMKKTAGVLGDDLALNAEQVQGVRAERELPVIWAVFKGSALNKCILVPAALAISAVAPWLITPLLMLGGAFLCFEGFEKIAHSVFHHKTEAHKAQRQAKVAAMADAQVDMVAFEREKIKGAIRTDFILSAEIIVIALGAVQSASFPTQVSVVATVAALITLGVYGLVAAIVKLDDAGLWLMKTPDSVRFAAARQTLGSALLSLAPHLMKTLSVVGTAAMFLVGGGILVHGLSPVHDLVLVVEASLHGLSGWASVLAALLPTVLNGLFGLVAGGVLVGLMSVYQRLRGTAKH